MNMRSR
jgi:hypothetical protein